MKTKVLLSILSVASIGLIVYALRDDQIENNGVNLSEKNKEISNSRVTQHFNMVIVPDLSNRVTKPKPVDDLKIIESILNDISPIYLKSQNRRMGQKDQFQVLLTNQSLIKLGKKKISENNIVIIEFNEMGLVSSKNILDQDDMNDIKIAENKTFKKFGQDNFVYNLMSTLREKINAPTRRNK